MIVVVVQAVLPQRSPQIPDLRLAVFYCCQVARDVLVGIVDPAVLQLSELYSVQVVPPFDSLSGGVESGDHVQRKGAVLGLDLVGVLLR